jgi:hypothetical protein
LRNDSNRWTHDRNLIPKERQPGSYQTFINFATLAGAIEELRTTPPLRRRPGHA